jgi:hypothetical protein
MAKAAPDYHLNADWDRLLNDAGIEYETKDDGTGKISIIDCPFCDDSVGEKKAWISWKTAKFHCHKGCHGLAVDVLTHVSPTWKLKFDRLYKKVRHNTLIESELVEAYYSNWQQYGKTQWAKALRASIAYRGATDEAIERYRIGLAPGTGNQPARITIPVKDDEGRYIQIKKYLPSDFKDRWPSSTKFLCEVKGNAYSLFPDDQFDYDTIVICGGEFKALHAATALNPHGIGAVSLTGGEDAPLDAFAYRFEGKRVITCYDADAAGRRGAVRRCWELVNVAGEIRIATIPEELAEKKPKADVNDFINEYGETAFVELVRHAKKWEKPILDPGARAMRAVVNHDTGTDSFDGAQLVDLEDVVPGWFQASDLVLNGVYVDVYSVPSEAKITCSRNDPCCAICPVMLEPPEKRYSISADQPEIISLVGSMPKEEPLQMRKLFRIPPKCGAFQYEITHQTPCRLCSVSPDKPNKQKSMLAVVFGNLESGNLGVSMDFNGFLSKTNKGSPAFFITDAVGSSKSIKGFQLSGPDEEELASICACENTIESVEAKLHERYLDLAFNVTQIYNNDDLHMLYDLMFFSPLELRIGRPFHDVLIGTVKAFAVGETGMGKSRTLQHLHDHYGSLGKVIDGPNTTTAGVTAGLIKTLEGYKIALGEFAAMHGRFVGIEEMSGMHPDVIANIKETLSSGKIKMSKVQSIPDVDANVRVAVTSNFVDDVGVMLNSVQQISKLMELFHGQSVLRRFDIGMVVGGEKNTTPVPAEARLTKELCTKHLKWAWNADQITFTPEAIEACVAVEQAMVAKYSTSIGLVTSGDQRNKIARLSASLALILFTQEVTDVHVMVIAKLLDRLYSSPTFCYDKYTTTFSEPTEIDEDTAAKVCSMMNFDILRRELLARGQFTLTEIRQYLQEMGQICFNMLLRSNLAMTTARRDRRGEQICEVTKAGFKYMSEWQGVQADSRPEYTE